MTSGENMVAVREQDLDKLLTIIASAYQIAGAHDAPANILDVLADPESATLEQVEAMLPYIPDSRTSHAVAWRRLTKRNWEYRNTAPTASIHGEGWLPLFDEPTTNSLPSQSSTAIDCSLEALMRIRNAYISSIRPLDPNIPGKDIDRGICEYIESASKFAQAESETVAGVIFDLNGGVNTGSLPPTPQVAWINGLPPIGSKLIYRNTPKKGLKS